MRDTKLHTISNTRRHFIKTSLSAAIITQINTKISAAAPAYNPAPELQVPYWISGDGKIRSAFTLAEHKGKWVFLKCFQNWCPGCHSQGFPTLQKLIGTFGTNNENISFAAIQTTFEGHYTNTKEALRKLQLRYKLDIPFGHDEGDASLPNNNPLHYPHTMRTYQTQGTPWLILITPDRKVVYSNFHVKTDKLIVYLQEQFA